MGTLSDFIQLLKEWINYIFMWIAELGYWGIMLGLLVEVIPSEIVLSYGGYLVSQGHVTFLGAVLFGTIGGTAAQIFVYWIGRYGGRPFLTRYGKYLLIHKKHIDVAEKWFERYGAGVIFTARFIPVVRHAISIPAGIAKMSLMRFTILTTLAVIPWSAFFIYLGWTLGDKWREIDEKAEPYVVPFIIGAVALTGVYFIYKIIRRKRVKSGHDYGLEFLGREYRVLHHRRVHSGGNKQEIDHIVIGPSGVFHIESKLEINDDPAAQMYRHEYIIKEWLRELKLKSDVVGILCLTDKNGNFIGKSPSFTTVNSDRLLPYIKSYKAKKPLTQEEIDIIANLIKSRTFL